MNLLKELQRRNVIRMAGLYLVGAWLVTRDDVRRLQSFEMVATLDAAAESCAEFR